MKASYLSIHIADEGPSKVEIYDEATSPTAHAYVNIRDERDDLTIHTTVAGIRRLYELLGEAIDEAFADVPLEVEDDGNPTIQEVAGIGGFG